MLTFVLAAQDAPLAVQHQGAPLAATPTPHPSRLSDTVLPAPSQMETIKTLLGVLFFSPLLGVS